MGKCLVVVDVQAAMFELPRPLHDGAALLGNLRCLLDRARAAGSPVAHVQHTGPDGGPFTRGSADWQIHAAVTPTRGEYLVEKAHCDAFQNGRLMEALDRLGVRDVVICGLVTEGCVDTTVRRAFSLNLGVELASDCHSTTDGVVLPADLIKRHHNEVLKAFARVALAKDISFDGGAG